MKEIAQEIRKTVEQSKSQLKHLNVSDHSFKEEPGKWSKKEMLGHLIDSAANHHQRIVRACYKQAFDFPVYSQNDWVSIQHYHDSDWIELVELWSAYNIHLCGIISFIPETVLSEPCNIGKENPVTLEFVIKDYFRHLRHHLDKILPE